MTVSLVASDGRQLAVSPYSWGVLHVAVQEAQILPEDLWGPMRFSSGGALDRSQVASLRRFLRSKIGRRLGKNQRMFMNGDVADLDREDAILKHERELWKNFSLPRPVLDQILDFLKTAGTPLRVC